MGTGKLPRGAPHGMISQVGRAGVQYEAYIIAAVLVMTGFPVPGVLTAKLMVPPQSDSQVRGAAEGQQWLRPRRPAGACMLPRCRRRIPWSAADRTGRRFADDVGDGADNADAEHSFSPGSGPPPGLRLNRSFRHADGAMLKLPQVEPTNPCRSPADRPSPQTRPTADPINRGPL